MNFNIIAWFLTVSITSVNNAPNGLPSPGNNDPVIPFFIYWGIKDAASKAPNRSLAQYAMESNAALWDAAGSRVSRGGRTPWYTASSAPSDMTYECDAALGNPQEVDCSFIQWNQLGPASVSPPSEIITVGPGNTFFLNYSK